MLVGSVGTSSSRPSCHLVEKLTVVVLCISAVDRQIIEDLRFEEYVHWCTRSARNAFDDKLNNVMHEGSVPRPIKDGQGCDHLLT